MRRTTSSETIYAIGNALYNIRKHFVKFSTNKSKQNKKKSTENKTKQNKTKQNKQIFDFFFFK